MGLTAQNLRARADLYSQINDRHYDRDGAGDLGDERPIFQRRFGNRFHNRLLRRSRLICSVLPKQSAFQLGTGHASLVTRHFFSDLCFDIRITQRVKNQE